MLKGHIFEEQVWGNQICALFINTFLNGRDGISNNYKNGMELSYSGSAITISSGVAIIQGRILEEDTFTTISAGTDNMFCKLILEIDLDKQNTEESFQQAAFKVIKSSTDYPALTQNNIVKNNAGVYQYELARFKTNSNGITDFQDKRTYVDYQSVIDAMESQFEAVLEELEEELQSVEEGSAYVLQTQFTETISGINTQLGQKQKTLGKGTDNPSGGTNGDIYVQYYN